MKFLEEITATAGQLIKDLEQHLEKYPQIASEVVTVYSDGLSHSITDFYVDETSMDCHGNLIDFVSFEHNWGKNDDEGINAAKMLEVLKNLDPGAGVLYDEGEETLGETDSGFRNLYPETDENAEHEGTFICCYVEDDYVDLFLGPKDGEIKCLSGKYPK